MLHLELERMVNPKTNFSSQSISHIKLNNKLSNMQQDKFNDQNQIPNIIQYAPPSRFNHLSGPITPFNFKKQSENGKESGAEI